MGHFVSIGRRNTPTLFLLLLTPWKYSQSTLRNTTHYSCSYGIHRGKLIFNLLPVYGIHSIYCSNIPLNPLSSI
ncbi:hypothetical protein V8C43DRAFT_142458 [Trichoderma afarasin]